jgi:choline dehydrogenase-like flavoprotein
MFIDSRRIAEKFEVDTDLCIVGAGAAGIALARELAGKRLRVAVLESGYFKPDGSSRDLQAAHNVGRRYHALRFSRPRCFGGATNVWGGHCVPMRAINFEKRPGIPFSGWPFSLDELIPYYRRAHEMLNLGEFDYDARRASDCLGLPLFPFDPSRVETVLSRYTGVSRFEAPSLGEQYRNEFDRASNVDVYLGANVVAINQHPGSDTIEDVSVVSVTGRRFCVRARSFVLATGGIENARLLLLSNSVQSRGLGNQHDLVGRFFMEHIWYPSGTLIPAPGQPSYSSFYGANQLCCGIPVRGHLSLPQRVIREHEVPDFRAEIIVNSPPPFEWLLAVFHRIRERLKDCDLLDSAAITGLKLLRRFGRAARILDQAPSDSRTVVYRLANYVEQVPNPDSRVYLSHKLDRFGLRRVALDWRLSPLDRRGIEVAQRLLAAEVERTRLGRLRIELPDTEPEILHGANGGGHHMGTTRMNIDPRLGVVDANCRVHGLQNLYVAGSSVFPTGGFANPTLTIVALAIRLADHLQKGNQPWLA